MRWTGLLVAFTLAFTAIGVSTQQSPVPCAGPLSEGDFTLLLKGGLSEVRLTQWITSCGIKFEMTPDAEKRLRGAGGNDAIITLLRRHAPRPTNPSPTPSKEPAAGSVMVWPADGREMVRIAAGTFQMGSPASEKGRKEDETQHAVQTAAPFWIDVTEVTNEAFRKFVLQNPNWQKDKIDARMHDGNYLKDWNGNDFPAGKGDWAVVYVSWHAARAYAAWAGKRLPTEAEWEYAARAGTTTAYWWGDGFDPSHIGPRGPATTTDAGRRSPWGVVGMLGGVWEWTSARYASYPFVAEDGRDDPLAAGARVVRGGFWNSGERFLRAANRSSELPEVCSEALGFRCAK